MIGLVDCNNFFVSCERAVDPTLENRPVIVLSGGDGCVVAMSNEAKALGITRGIPLFKIRHIVDRHKVVKLRGRHDLYKALSTRVMDTLASLVDKIEIYSIDEAFMHLSPQIGDIAGFGRYVVEEIFRSTHIPVSVGIADTKTIAKIAARFAKKYPGYNGSCVIDTIDKRQRALELTDVADVWGIGRKLSARLNNVGIRTAADLASLPRQHVGVLLSLAGERTWRELNGEACIGHEYVPVSHRSMTSSRSFEHDIYDFDTLRSSVCGHVSALGRRLRRAKCHAGEIALYMRTNPFKPHLPQAHDTLKMTFEPPTADTLQLTSAAVKLLHEAYREGYGYKKIGITLTRMVADEEVQHGLFEDINDSQRRHRLMETLDRLNSEHPGTVNLSTRNFLPDAKHKR